MEQSQTHKKKHKISIRCIWISEIIQLSNKIQDNPTFEPGLNNEITDNVEFSDIKALHMEKFRIHIHAWIIRKEFQESHY